MNELDDLIARYINCKPLATDRATLEYIEPNPDNRYPSLVVQGRNLTWREDAELLMKLRRFPRYMNLKLNTVSSVLRGSCE